MKDVTVEDYKKRINLVTEYIANHLDEDISLGKLAELSCFSPYHFHRILRAFLQEPIGTHIIRIRMETAARLLRYSDLSVSEIAYRVGYDTPGSLTKTFRQFYGISPTEYKSNNNYFIMKPIKINSQLTIKGPRMVDLPERKVIYIKLYGEYGQLDFAGTWQRLWLFVKTEKLFSAGIEHLAIYHDDPKVTESGKLRTDLCLVITKEVVPKGEIGVKVMSSGKYAVFLYQGSYDQLEAVYDTIYGRLLPDAGLRLREAPCFDKYLNHPGRVAPENLKTEIYVPVE
ncbi:MAG: AraC family transcriptional regulator [Bacteroidota bacterium]|nr:AraC family transcriptional regulator [Bacteroidota bacterium]